MEQEIAFAGFGGQGVLFAADVLANAAMMSGKHVAWIPSYGPEMRGGTASAIVVISDEEVGSLVVDALATAVVMNPPSLDKYEDKVRPGGMLIINRSLITRDVRRKDIAVIEVRANDLAAALGNDRLANMVVLGTVIAATGAVTVEQVVAALKACLSEKKAHLLAGNEAALRRGMESAVTFTSQAYLARVDTLTSVSDNGHAELR